MCTYKNKKCRNTALLLIILAVLLSMQLTEPVFGGNYGMPDENAVAKRMLRGIWISTVINLDWPSKETSLIEDDAERILKSKEELVELLKKAVEMNMNAVFFQVSPEGDALYKSDIVPWSRYLTGTFGRDPGFDPLEFAIEEAHKRNLEFHAWFNPYRVSMNTNPETMESLNINNSIYREHPEIIRTARNRFVVDPGMPASMEWVVKRVLEVVNNYDIDGIHFDDYFYSEDYIGEMKDEDTYAEYNRGQFGSIADWRRNNTYTLVKMVSLMIESAKPWVKFGISPGGIWANIRDGHADGSNTSTWYTNYDCEFVDTKKWVEDEIIDYIAPQLYYTTENKNAPYEEVASWWANVCMDKNVQLYIGQALYKINDDTDRYFLGNNAVPQFSRQYIYNVSKAEISGSIMFRVKNFYDGKKLEPINIMKDALWSTKSLVPVMPWKGGKAPAAPELGQLGVANEGVKLSWTDNDPATAYYVIYRYVKGENFDVESNNAAGKIIDTIRRDNPGEQEYTDSTRKNTNNLVYVVTALDRLHNESSGLFLVQPVN